LHNGSSDTEFKIHSMNKTFES